MLQNYNFYRVLKLFLDSPTRGFGWKEISKKLDLGPPSVKRYLDEMETEGLVSIKILYKRKLYFAKRESRKFRIWKIFDIFIEMENCGLVGFLEKELKFPVIILFGSFASGEATEKSDVDIAVLSAVKKELKMEEFEKRLGRTIHIFLYTKEEFSGLKKKNRDLYNGILNGKILSGYLKVA